MGELYESIIAVSQSMEVVIVLVAIWIIPILIWSLLGVVINTKIKGGRRFMAQSPNFYWFYLIALSQGLLIFFGIIFPVWAKISWFP